MAASASRFNPKPDAFARCEIKPREYVVSGFSRTVMRFCRTVIRFRGTCPTYLTHKPIRDERDHASAVRCKSLARENRA
jgi:hypothetical protein